VSAAVPGLAPATTYHFRIVAENGGGISYGADQSFTTLPALPPGPVKTLPALLLGNLTQSHSVWRLGHALAKLARTRAPVGTKFSFTLNQPASVTFTFIQQLGGRRVHGKCVAQTKATRHKRACRRSVTRGTLSFAGHKGRNKVSFQGRISRTKTLKPGTYTVRVTGANGKGSRSSPKQLTFTIVR
jgi:hypothetical protein